jgi:hypothetical protein
MDSRDARSFVIAFSPLSVKKLFRSMGGFFMHLHSPNDVVYSGGKFFMLRAFFIGILIYLHRFCIHTKK